MTVEVKQGQRDLIQAFLNGDRFVYSTTNRLECGHLWSSVIQYIIHDVDQFGVLHLSNHTLIPLTSKQSRRFLDCCTKVSCDFLMLAQLNEECLIRASRDVSWAYMSKYQILSESFIREHVPDNSLEDVLRLQDLKLFSAEFVVECQLKGLL